MPLSNRRIRRRSEQVHVAAPLRMKRAGVYFTFLLSRNRAEKICRWGYYTPTPPRCSGTLITFCRAGCKNNASRLLKAAKFFAPLTTM